jgi:DTW domain-containing protein YfiP
MIDVSDDSDVAYFLVNIHRLAPIRRPLRLKSSRLTAKYRELRMLSDTPKPEIESSCERCEKSAVLCVCDSIKAHSTRVRLLILQHPREARNPLGTARLTSLNVSNGIHRVGLSWPSLSAAVGTNVDAKRWSVLFLGTLKDDRKFEEGRPFQIRNKAGELVALKKVEGIVLLDGNWKQSKTLWWRNPWLLKLSRIRLAPGQPSAYAPLRKQPRKHCLSTIEAAAESFQALGENPEVAQGLRRTFAAFLERAEKAGL